MKRLVLFIILFTPLIANAQIGVDYQFSNLPFLGISYEINDRFRPEIRIGTDAFIEDISIEGIVTYDILNKVDYEFYAGLGARSSDFAGLVIPVGFNFYPFDVKNFGFQFEITPILGESNILRGSLGIKYKFLTDKVK